MSIQVVILAAGKGKRMHSSLPKVLHVLAGKSMLEHVLDTAAVISPKKPPVVVYGHQGDVLRDKLKHKDVVWVEQQEQQGTGHAVLQALPLVSVNDRVLILYGDVPLISAKTLQHLIDATPANAVGILTANLDNPFGYGRIKRDAGSRIIGVVEEKDASPDERHIHEINSGIFFVPASYLNQWLPSLKNHNSQKEYYLTDIISLAVQAGLAIHSVQPGVIEEILGVNDKVQLAHLERCYQRQAADDLMRQGVTLMDPARIDVRGEVKIGRDVVIDVNAIFEGQVVIGDNCVIGPNCVLKNTTLGKGITINANSVLDNAIVGDDCVIGPFARLRPEAVLDKKVHIGNFVEIKKSHVGQGSKVNHLTYIGDSELGKGVNVGAGTITCNYDGVNKHKTIIGDDAFIGSNTLLVAPVTIGAGATTGAGSTITQDVPANKLTLSRVPQCTLDGWQRPKKT